MKKECKHDWLYVGNVSRHTKASENLLAIAETPKYYSLSFLEKVFNRTPEKILPNVFSYLEIGDAMEYGKKYQCANCDKIKAVYSLKD